MIRVGVPAPSWRGTAEEVFRGVKILEEMGLHVRLGPMTRFRPRFNTPFAQIMERVEEFVAMLRSDEVDLIWCCDGGAGASYLLPILKKEWEKEPWDTSKAVIGFSDCTFLLMYLVKLGHACFLGQCVTCEDPHHAPQLRVLVEFLLGKREVWQEEVPVEILREGEATGILLGGTLSVLRAMAGTEYCPSFKDSIVFFEEHGFWAPGQCEYMLWDQLQGIELAKHFVGSRAIAVGRIQIVGPYEDEQLFPDLWDVLEKTLLWQTDGPVISGLPFGLDLMHGPLLIGAEASLRARNGRCTLSWVVPEWMRWTR